MTTAERSVDRSDPVASSMCGDAAHAQEGPAAVVDGAPTLRPQAVSVQVRDASSDHGSGAGVAA